MTEKLITLLSDAGLLAPDQSFTWCRFAGDGSDRRFFRCETGSNEKFIIILPSLTQPLAMSEARSGFAIGRHLHAMGVPVPRPYAFAEDSGALICEDLGNTSLYDAAGPAADPAARIALYRRALESLAAFQIKGRIGFDPAWCWDSRHYDQELMLERESHYFSREFCQGYMNMAIPGGLENDFRELATRISREPTNYLLHRDFQSRNLLIVNANIMIIDFQGARLGPLGYDLASLLNDPYVDLTAADRDDLRQYYLTCINRYMDIDPTAFTAGYYHLALQRNLQVLGAYAYLTLVKKKTFFAQYILPATRNLIDLLRQKLSGKYPILQKLSAEIYASLVTTHP
jgi:aminoglycoside/choline kinase family phosphotransferase